jgi:tetratricopeptide (TPR) repeat protein
MLGRLLDLTGEDATVMVVSDHGMCSGDFRPRGASGARAEHWHRGRGFLCISGPGLRQDELIHGAGLLDIAPTVLTLFDLPVGDDMEGRPLLAAWKEPPVVGHIASWESDGGRARQRGGSAAPDHGACDDDLDAAINDLAAQGYVDGLAEALPPLNAAIKQENDLHLAQVHLGAGRPQRALPLLLQLHECHLDNESILLYLAYCRYLLGQYDDCSRLLSAMSETSVDRPLRHLLLAMVDLARHRPQEALERLTGAQQTHRRDPQILCFLGQAFLQLNRNSDAQAAFGRALEIDSEFSGAHLGLAQSFARERHWQQAADAALRAVAVDHHQPAAHFLLGVALARMQQAPRAIVAFQTVLAQEPGSDRARRWLAKVDHQVRGDALRAALGRRCIANATRAAAADRSVLFSPESGRGS